MDGGKKAARRLLYGSSDVGGFRASEGICKNAPPTLRHFAARLPVVGAE